jgi:hypothetical protein
MTTEEDVDVNDHDNHVKGVRLHLWAAATNGPIVHPPGDVWALRAMMELYWQSKTPISFTRALWQ